MNINTNCERDNTLSAFTGANMNTVIYLHTQNAHHNLREKGG